MVPEETIQELGLWLGLNLGVTWGMLGSNFVPWGPSKVTWSSTWHQLRMLTLKISQANIFVINGEPSPLGGSTGPGWKAK